MNKPMPLWKIMLLWLAVGIGCIVWTYDGDIADASTTTTYSA